MKHSFNQKCVAWIISNGRVELDLEFDSLASALACFDLFAPTSQAQYTRGVK